MGDHGFGRCRLGSFGLSGRRLFATRGRVRPLAVYRLRGLGRDGWLDGLPLRRRLGDGFANLYHPGSWRRRRLIELRHMRLNGRHKAGAEARAFVHWKNLGFPEFRGERRRAGPAAWSAPAAPTAPFAARGATFLDLRRNSLYTGHKSQAFVGGLIRAGLRLFPNLTISPAATTPTPPAARARQPLGVFLVLATRLRDGLGHALGFDDFAARRRLALESGPTAASMAAPGLSNWFWSSLFRLFDWRDFLFGDLFLE
jgi:hypothetical protein